jgi:hypothetical protein
MTIHVRVLTLAVCLSVLSVFATAAVAAEIRTQLPCTSPSGYCLRFFAEDDEIPVIRTFRFNAPSAGTAAVGFHGSLVCSGPIVAPINSTDTVVDLVTQIVAAADAVPVVSGRGALRLATVLKHTPEHALISSDTFNLASTRVFPIQAAGTQTYRFKIAALRMDALTTCLVYNAAFTVHFVP